jgi:hypothetical protein
MEKKREKNFVSSELSRPLEKRHRSAIENCALRALPIIMGFALQASRCLRIPRDGSALPARVEVPRSLIKRAARRRSDGRFGRRQSAAAATTSTASGGGGGDTLDLDLPPRLSLSISEPCFSVSLTYDAGGGPLDGSSRVVARVGVAAWQWTQDVELVRSGGGSGLGGKDGKEGGDAAAEKPDSEKPPTTQKQQLWAGFVSVPASRLPAPGHLDLQAAFFAPRGAFGPESEERWDNAGGLNWGEGGGERFSYFFVFLFVFLFSPSTLKLTFPDSFSPPLQTTHTNTHQASPPTSPPSAPTPTRRSRASRARRPLPSRRGLRRACCSGSMPWPQRGIGARRRCFPWAPRRCCELSPAPGTGPCSRPTSGAGRGRTTRR